MSGAPASGAGTPWGAFRAAQVGPTKRDVALVLRTRLSAPRSRRLEAETIDRLVAQYVDGTTAAEVGRRYGVAKSSVLQLVRQAGRQVRQPRLSISQTAQLVALYQAGLSQKDIAA